MTAGSASPGRTLVVGYGVTGRAVTASLLRRGADVVVADDHPDTGALIAGLKIPQWDFILESDARGYEVTGLGYLGVDMVIDADRGPLMLEMNARPGLNIQIAKRWEGEPKNIIMGALAGHADIKQVVVVDEDVDVHDSQAVEWAVATRFQASRDLVVVPGAATDGMALARWRRA